MLTIAPTGTTSLMSQTTSGIEPVFRPGLQTPPQDQPFGPGRQSGFRGRYGRKVRRVQRLSPQLRQMARSQRIRYLETRKTISDDELNRWVAASPYHGATANDIDWVAKVKMQGEIQKWVDHSISVTVNLPNDVSEALVADVYRTAWECGCKGRNGLPRRLPRRRTDR